MTKVLAVDPGQNLGYCVMKKDLTILTAGLINVQGSMSWDARVPFIIRDVMKIYRKHLPTNFVLEIPEHWSGSAGFAARESGSVYKLTFLAGALFGIMEHSKLATIMLLRPSEWKGQMKKELAHRRLFEHIPDAERYTNHNTLDAIALAYVSLRGDL